MKLILSFLVALLALSQQALAINVSGVLSGITTFTKNNSPYVVNGSLLVDKGAVLYIEPGTEIRVDPGVNFFVDGSVQAIGTSADPIIFKSTSANPNRYSWKGINARTWWYDSLTFAYCQFQSSENALVTAAGDISITHCVFTECQLALGVNGEFIVTDNTIKHCDRGFSGSGGKFSGNEVANCGDGITVWGDVEVSNNYIHDVWGGITYKDNGSIKVWDCQIADNTVANSKDFGISVEAKDVNGGVYDNLCAYNARGLVIGFFGGDVKNNTAVHNKVGVQMSLPYQVFKNNCIDSSTEYNLKIYGTWAVDVSGNYWGTTDSSVMQSRIYDFNDDFISGKVQFIPLLSPLDGSCKSYTGPIVTKVPDTKAERVAIVVAPNPFSDRFVIDLKGQADKLEVCNMAGQTIYSADVTNKNKLEIDMSAYPAGIYHYRAALTDNTTATGKLVKQ